MTLRELEIFYRLGDLPHLSRVAETMGMSQSALSLALRSLERKLGEPLFDRLGKRLVLNERGRYFRAETQTHYLALKEAQKLFERTKISGTLTLASSKTIGNYLMPQIILTFLVRYPDVRIIHRVRNSNEIMALVREGAVDMGFIEAPCSEHVLQATPLGRDRLIVVSSDPTLAETEVFIDQLFGRRWLLREEGSGTRQVFLEGLGTMADDLKVFMEYNDFEEAKTLLLHNRETITCISEHVVEREIEEGKLFEVPIRGLVFERDFHRLHHRDKYQSTLFRTFADWSRHAIAPPA